MIHTKFIALLSLISWQLLLLSSCLSSSKHPYWPSGGWHRPVREQIHPLLDLNLDHENQATNDYVREAARATITMCICLQYHWEVRLGRLSSSHARTLDSHLLLPTK